MGVQQPRAYTMPQHPQMPSSPSMVSAASPATRKRRFMDIILVGEDHELSTSEVDEEAELTQRVTFKRSKSGEAPMSVHVDRTEILCDTSSQPGTPMDKSPTSKDASSPSSSSTKSSRPNMSASQTITLDMLRPHFEKPLAQVAQVFGICVTLLKKICRKNGLARWPHRQIIGLRKSIASMEQAIGHFEGARRDSYAQQLEKQRSKLAKLLEDPTSCNLLAVEDEFLPTQHIMDQHTRATTAQQMTPQTSHYSSYAPSPVYETHAYAPAYSYPTGYSYHSAQPTLASPPRLSYAPQHYYPTPYSQPAAPTHQPSASLTLPPLRTDSRPLPPLSALVGRRW